MRYVKRFEGYGGQRLKMLFINWKTQDIKLVTTDLNSPYFQKLIANGYFYVGDIRGWRNSLSSPSNYNRGKRRMLMVNFINKDIKLITTNYNSDYFRKLIDQGYKYSKDVTGENSSLKERGVYGLIYFHFDETNTPRNKDYAGCEIIAIYNNGLFDGYIISGRGTGRNVTFDYSYSEVKKLLFEYEDFGKVSFIRRPTSDEEAIYDKYLESEEVKDRFDL